MKAIIKFTKDSPYYIHGEKERIVDNLTEIHYSFNSPFPCQSTAFESDIDCTGFTIKNDYIKEFEVFNSK